MDDQRSSQSLGDLYQSCSYSAWEMYLPGLHPTWQFGVVGENVDPRRHHLAAFAARASPTATQLLVDRGARSPRASRGGSGPPGRMAPTSRFAERRPPGARPWGSTRIRDLRRRGDSRWMHELGGVDLRRDSSGRPASSISASATTASGGDRPGSAPLIQSCEDLIAEPAPESRGRRHTRDRARTGRGSGDRRPPLVGGQPEADPRDRRSSRQAEKGSALDPRDQDQGRPSDVSCTGIHVRDGQDRVMAGAWRQPDRKSTI